MTRVLARIPVMDLDEPFKITLPYGSRTVGFAYTDGAMWYMAEVPLKLDTVGLDPERVFHLVPLKGKIPDGIPFFQLINTGPVAYAVYRETCSDPSVR